MLRSFDYAARHMLVEQPDDPQRAYRAQEWAERNRQRVLHRLLRRRGGLDPCGESPLLRAFEADKAVYECVYEARNRPHWLMIPLHSLPAVRSRLTGRDCRDRTTPSTQEDGETMTTDDRGDVPQGRAGDKDALQAP